MRILDIDDPDRPTGPLSWVREDFCASTIRAALREGRPKDEVIDLARSRFSDFRTGTECPRCGLFDMHWLEPTQNHVAVIRTCRSVDCGFSWEQV